MSEHADNLATAARLIRRIANIRGPIVFEGVALHELAAECSLAAFRVRADELRDEIAGDRRTALWQGDLPDEIAVGARNSNVIELALFSRKVEAS